MEINSTHKKLARQKFYPDLRGGEGANSLGRAIFPFCSPSPLINDWSFNHLLSLANRP